MKTTRTASTLKLNVAGEAPPPDLPAVVEPEALPPARAEKPLTPEGLTAMLAERRHRSDGWTPIRVAAFIEALAETTSVTKAAAYVNMSTAACYHLRNHPDAQGFREAWDNAVAARFETLTDIAMDRIVNGVEKTRWWHDVVVGHERVFSDNLLVHMLRRCDPDRAAGRAGPAAPPARGVLPMAPDFVVAVAVETGKLGWDPDLDAEWDPDIAAQVAREQGEREARKAADAAEFAEEVRLDRVEEAKIASEMNTMRSEDAEWERRYAEASSLSKSLTYASSPRRSGRRGDPD